MQQKLLRYERCSHIPTHQIHKFHRNHIRKNVSNGSKNGEYQKNRKSYQFTRFLSFKYERVEFLNAVNPNHLPFFGHWESNKNLFCSAKVYAAFEKEPMKRDEKGDEDLYRQSKGEYTFTKIPLYLTFITGWVTVWTELSIREGIWQKMWMHFLLNNVVSSKCE